MKNRTEILELLKGIDIHAEVLDKLFKNAEAAITTKNLVIQAIQSHELAAQSSEETIVGIRRPTWFNTRVKEVGVWPDYRIRSAMRKFLKIDELKLAQYIKLFTGEYKTSEKRYSNWEAVLIQYILQNEEKIASHVRRQNSKKQKSDLTQKQKEQIKQIKEIIKFLESKFSCVEIEKLKMNLEWQPSLDFTIKMGKLGFARRFMFDEDLLKAFKELHIKQNTISSDFECLYAEWLNELKPYQDSFCKKIY